MVGIRDERNGIRNTRGGGVKGFLGGEGVKRDDIRS